MKDASTNADTQFREGGNWKSIVLPPFVLLTVSVIADFVLAKAVGISLRFDVLAYLMLYAAVQAGIGYWVGWKMFRSGPALAQWHVFGVFVSGALAASLYLCAQLFLGGRNMPSSDSSAAMIFNILAGFVMAVYLALRLANKADNPHH